MTDVIDAADRFRTKNAKYVAEQQLSTIPKHFKKPSCVKKTESELLKSVEIIFDSLSDDELAELMYHYMVNKPLEQIRENCSDYDPRRLLEGHKQSKMLYEKIMSMVGHDLRNVLKTLIMMSLSKIPMTCLELIGSDNPPEPTMSA